MLLAAFRVQDQVFNVVLAFLKHIIWFEFVAPHILVPATAQTFESERVKRFLPLELVCAFSFLIL